MKRILAAILNLPWAFLGLVGAILSIPSKVSISWKPFAVIFYVRSFWWWNWQRGQKGTRGMTNTWLIQLGPTADAADLEHELIHAEQAEREPFIHPILYILETRRRGYRANKYEEEAYSRSGSRYLGS